MARPVWEDGDWRRPVNFTNSPNIQQTDFRIIYGWFGRDFRALGQDLQANNFISPAQAEKSIELRGRPPALIPGPGYGYKNHLLGKK